MLGCGAAPLGREHIEAIEKQIGVGVKQGYEILAVAIFEFIHITNTTSQIWYDRMLVYCNFSASG